MKASVYTQYGPPEVLQWADVPKPTPRDHEVLVKVLATTVTIGDTIMRSFKLPNITGWQKFMARLILGWNKPRRHILGMELAGEIEAVGRKVTRFKPGDPIFASTFDVNFGGHAEYKCLPEKGVIAIKPANLTYEEAAAIPGAGRTRNLQPRRIEALSSSLSFTSNKSILYGILRVKRTICLIIPMPFSLSVLLFHPSHQPLRRS